ncbi:MAG: histidinol-phosphate transaminase, partial [Microbacterium sp.]
MGRVTASLGDLPLRDDLRGLTPYGAPQAPLPVALNVNENTHPVPDEVASDILDDIAVALREVNRYPDREFTTLRTGFAEYLGHDLRPEQIWAGNGSNEVLQHIMQAFGGPGRTVFGFAPTYSMYPLIAQGTGARWVAGQREADYTITAEEAAAQVAQADPDIVLLCSPNNPTGTPLGLDVVEAVYEATRGIVVVDEAYQEFAPRDAVSALTLLGERPRLAVSRTMSKAFAFAGARVGYLAADPAFIDALRLVRLPYHLSALTQAAAVAALRNADTMLGMVDEIVEQRDRITATLEALDYQPHESWSNFVLFGGVADPRATFEALYERGILVRDIGIPNHLRVTAGTET